ncbi:hypothetical protein, conserved [Babesia bigemina]|uniref:Uncharacterized protein n=1 Tax=Babesia bigemina TaxID=5866 RepID=A0A061DBC0_BABBI|nr:hypothetical protein, conserved [Babesia bigemina]CDR97818.1 hypothetical protein, conserved [Babesia bigemina]|eukprot:XP_012770004.1 hypothetical protein, conserved [Babesia bigemina]
MFMCTRRLRFRKDHNPLQGFLCNRKVDLLTRLQGLAKRLRLRSKLYNGRQRAPHTAQDLKEPKTLAKVTEDSVDYDRVTRELLGELLTKVTFLSNRECILILDLLGRIKKPLHRCRADRKSDENEGSNVETTCSPSLSVCGVDAAPVCRGTVHHLPIPEKYGAIANDQLVRFVVKAQKMLLNHLLKAHEQKVLTKAQKYYLTCILSRECSLASVERWASIMDELKRDLELRKDYSPFECANLLLVYDQICRWMGKRLTRTSKRAATRELTCNPNQACSHVGDSNMNLNLDPFDSDFFDVALNRLEPMLSQLTPEKVIKLLYLQRSRRIYSKTFMHSAAKCLSELEWSNMKYLKMYTSAIGIYHKVSMANLWSEFKNIYASQESHCGLIHDGSPMLRIVTNEVLGVDTPAESHGVSSLRLKATSELAECTSFCLVALIINYTINICQSYNLEHSGFKALENRINGHNFGNEALKETLLRCMLEDTPRNVSQSFGDGNPITLRIEGIVEIVLGHIYFNHCVLMHLSPDQGHDQIRQRSHLNLHILYELVLKLVELRSDMPIDSTMDQRNAELQVIAKVRKAINELLRLDADLCGFHGIVKGLLNKLDAIDRRLDDS